MAKNREFTKQIIPPMIETLKICEANVTAYPIPTFCSNGILTHGNEENILEIIEIKRDF